MGGIILAKNPTAVKVAGLIKDLIEEQGLTLWDVKFVKEGASWYLRVFIDKDGGVDINDCTDVSRLIDPVIDEADPINVSYYLEVCSPGLERELRTDEHITASIGQRVEAKLFAPKDGRKSVVGTLTSYEDGVVTVTEGDTPIALVKSDIARLTTLFFEN